MSQSMRTELGKVRGLGSAHHGTHHWWMQRLSAIALVPLTIWFIISVLSVSPFLEATKPVETMTNVIAYFAHPLNALMAALLIICTFYHLQLGLQTVIEDYVHSAPVKITTIIAVKFASFVIAVACLTAVLRISLYYY